MENITIENLYDLKETIAADLFTEAEYPWEVLPRIHDFILELGKRLPEEIYEKRGEDIWVAKNAKVAPTACLNGPGDSVLGFKSHMGAGSITSNVKSDKTLVVVKNGEEKIETGLKKMGAMLGDHVEVGCNSVLNPGTVIGRNSNVYPTSCVRGVIPAGHIFKRPGDVVKKDNI